MGEGGGRLLLHTVLFMLSDVCTLVYLLRDFSLGETRQDVFQDKTLGFVLYVLVFYVVVCVFSYFDVVPVHTKNNTKADIKNYFVC